MPLFTELTLLGLIFAAILGSLIGSFANVVIHRLPKGESIAFPGSRCPSCGRRLSALELVPVLSWLAQGGRCRGCRAPISFRYPLVELVVAAGFALLWLRFPPTQMGWSLLPLAALFVVLVILAAIDIDTFTLPDVLTLPALALALIATLLYPPQSGMPTPAGALAGAAAGAGVLSLVNRIGALVLRRFRDTGERLWPIGFDQVNLAALGGALSGWLGGVTIAGLSLLANVIARRPLRLPEPLLYSLWAAALLLSATGITVSVLDSAAGSVIAAGAAAIVGAIFWWLHDLLSGDGREARATGAQSDAGSISAEGDGQGTKPAQGTQWTKAVQGTSDAQATSSYPDHDASASAGQNEAEDEEPVAMGFGDVKLAAVMGAMLGPGRLLLALFLSFLVGAVGGLTLRALGGDRVVPFGPYLVIAALLSLFFGNAIIDWYLGLLGV